MERDQELLASLENLETVRDFENWVMFQLRLVIPHAALLVTVGKLYGVGSVPTHRVTVDFPLELLESLKNSAGAFDDPSLHGWFRSNKPRFYNLATQEPVREQQEWQAVLESYGFRSVLIHGFLDHAKRRFATYQFFNCHNGGSLQNIKLLSMLAPAMAEVIWRGFFSKRTELVGRRMLTGHPTLALTEAELHIVELIAQGLSNKEIARRRGVSDSTVKTQVQRTGAKVGATRRAEIVALALPLLSLLPPQSIIDYGE